MSTLIQKGLEMPQRVRQFVIEHDPFDMPLSGSVEKRQIPLIPNLLIPKTIHGLDSTALLNAEVSLSFGDEEDSEAKVNRTESESDLPFVLRNRSLRRRLDAAFEKCYRSPVATWLESLLTGLFRNR